MFIHLCQKGALTLEDKKMKKIIAIFVVVTVSVFSSYGEVSPEKEAVLKKLFNITKIEDRMLGGFDAMLPVVNQLATQLHLNAEETVELKNIYRNWFKNDIDRTKITSALFELYAKTFTVKEINELIAFYKTPTGQKVLTESPKIMKEAAKIGMKEAQDKQSKLIERLRPFIKKHRHK